MADAPYTKREIDLRFDGLEHRLFDDKEGFLPRIEAQTIKHNGRMSRVERVLLIVGTAVGVLLFTNGSELLGFVMSIL